MVCRHDGAGVERGGGCGGFATFFIFNKEVELICIPSQVEDQGKEIVPAVQMDRIDKILGETLQNHYITLGFQAGDSSQRSMFQVLTVKYY